MQYRGKPVQKYDNVYTVSFVGGLVPLADHSCSLVCCVCVLQWKQFMELGTEVETVQVDNIIHRQRPEQCALLIYTVSHYFYKSLSQIFAPS